MIKWTTSVLISVLPFLYGCGGDEEGPSGEAAKTQEEPTTPEPLAEVKPEPLPEPEPEPLDPNGFYFETGEVLNKSPVYKDAEGFFLWFDGNKWNLSDKQGGGNVISSSRDTRSMSAGQQVPP